jgi:uncharacterized protein YdcH (DUF465 family)
MVSGNEVLGRILSEFPQQNEKIFKLYEQSSSFIEICEDYVLCLDAISKLENLEDMVRVDEVIELRKALKELKEELLTRL